MDTFTFLVALMLLMLAFQFGENWLVFAVIGVMALSMKSLSTTILLVISAGVLYFVVKTTGDITAYWPVVVFGLIILSLVMNLKTKEQQPEMFPPDMGYGDMMGGMGGGMGGLGGGGGYGGMGGLG